MRPRADEILHSVIATYEEYVLPEVRDPFARSVALTTANLLRHVNLRIQHEGPALAADNAELRALLAVVRSFLHDVGGEGDVTSLLVDLDAIGDARTTGPAAYPTLTDLIDDATDLRWLLQRAIRLLEGRRAELEPNPAYGPLRRDIRRYLRASLEREGALVVPAFTGERR